MDRIMTVSRDSRWTVRLALAAVAALLWVVTQGPVVASAGNDADEPRGQQTSQSKGGGGKGHGASVRWR